MSSSATPWYVKGILYVGIPAACIAALYLSIPGEVALAKTAGWSDHYAPAMPVCLSVYALAAGAIATYRRKMQLPGQVTALLGSLAALMLAMSAQSISHLIEQGYMSSSALLVVAVSCVPPLTIAHLVHMAETPSQVRSAAEETADLQALLTWFAAQVNWFSAQAFDTVMHDAQALVQEYDSQTDWAEELSESVDALLGQADAELAAEEAEQSKASRRGGPRKAVSEEQIRAAARELSKAGGKVTGERLAARLGVGVSTATRYMRQGLVA